MMVDFMSSLYSSTDREFNLVLLYLFWVVVNVSRYQVV